MKEEVMFDRLFLDTSSLVKLYINELDSEIIIHSFRQYPKRILSELAKIEFKSAIYKKYRYKLISLEKALEIIWSFENDYILFEWITINQTIISLASALLDKYGSYNLRTLDAIQLASAIAVKSPETKFLCSDKVLNELFDLENLEPALL